MKLYIATPINARKEPTMREKLISAKHRVEMLKEILADDVQFKDYELISTFDFNNMYDADEEKAMSRCIYHVLTSDAIYLDHGWTASKGCNLEYSAAKIYCKQIYEHDKLYHQINKREKQQKYCCDCKWLSSGIFEEGRCQKKYDKVPFWCPACEYFEEIKISKL